MRLEVTREVDAPPQVVWDVLTRWEEQPRWMLDARAVEVLTPQRRGVGVTVRCPTLLLGVTVEDVMRVTRYDEPRALEVTHLGNVISGDGGFELEPAGAAATRLTWWEEIDPPLGRLGAWGATTLVLPVLRRIFGRSLARLGVLAEAEAAAARTR
jgi:carbon monoxide dehydrogenase subunit G